MTNCAMKEYVVRRRATNKKYRETHREILKERQRKWRASNKDKIYEKNRKYKLKNLERLKEKRREYRLKNREKINKKSHEWKENHESKFPNSAFMVSNLIVSCSDCNVGKGDVLLRD